MNLLSNPSFNEGHHHQDAITELVVPNDWRLHFLDGDTFPGGSDQPALRPESVVWNIKDAPEHEKDLFFLDGDFCLKVFKAHAPVYFALTQEMSGLTPDTPYRFTAQVYPDIVKGYQGGKKVRPGDIWHAEARAGWSSPDTAWPEGRDGAVNWSAWFNVSSGNFAFGEYCDIWHEFIAPSSGQVRVWLECKAKWADAENNWFMDAFSLESVESLVEPTKPSEDDATTTKPKPARGAPRVQYARTYLLLPEEIRPDMAQAAMRVALATGVTVGFSPDDGGIGDLDQRRVVSVNPDQIASDLTAWYDEFYPGVEVAPITADNAAELEEKLNQLLSPTT
jgi:hypothetical protein